ncbi:hypothetical protein L2E82_36397 [Cichorium intybus]|uniref:Uncharacterized protein n=1 Tax=Cichorium intybus TaxID=13427 RepID=A0ACB9BRS5_CICIN|nr:hypothetical protein L2E82_36397 [Cichorium intybus]
MNFVENTLELDTSKGEVLESRMNELFAKTEVLCLSVGDMNDLLDLEQEVLIPKLEELFIDDMENLKEIWPYEFSRIESSHKQEQTDILLKEETSRVVSFDKTTTAAASLDQIEFSQTATAHYQTPFLSSFPGTLEGNSEEEVGYYDWTDKSRCVLHDGVNSYVGLQMVYPFCIIVCHDA